MRAALLLWLGCSLIMLWISWATKLTRSHPLWAVAACCLLVSLPLAIGIWAVVGGVVLLVRD